MTSRRTTILKPIYLASDRTRHISIRGDTYVRLRTRCNQLGISIAQLVTELIHAGLGDPR